LKIESGELKMKKNVIKDKSYRFALSIIHFCYKLKADKHFESASQILRSGTSIGAKVEEALSAQSTKDFIS
jgi:four helix bundle protein